MSLVCEHNCEECHKHKSKLLRNSLKTHKLTHNITTFTEDHQRIALCKFRKNAENKIIGTASTNLFS